MSRAVQRHTGQEVSTIEIETLGALLTLFSIVLFLALVSFDRGDLRATVGMETQNLLGPFGAHMADLFYFFLGLGAYPVNLALMALGVSVVMRRNVELWGRKVGWLTATLLACLVLLEAVPPHALRPFGYPAGGTIGLYSEAILTALLSRTGTIIVASLLAATGVVYGLGGNIALVLRQVANAWRALGRVSWIRTGAKVLRARRPGAADGSEEADASERSLSSEPDSGTKGEQIAVKIVRHTPEVPERAEISSEPLSVEPYWVSVEPDRPPRERDEKGLQEVAQPGCPHEARSKNQEQGAPEIIEHPRRTHGGQDTLVLPPTRGVYERPPLTLLDFLREEGEQAVDPDVLRANASTLEKKLRDFRVDGRVVEIHPGPVVTMYEFLPAKGVRIREVANLTDDLAMALEAISIRIVAPIPGKGVVGIEVPNQQRETVYLREVLASDAFRKSRGKLTLAMGKDIFGNPVVADLSKMPHLLIAGATGSGKSVAINAFLLSLLYNASPEEARLILIDPKVVELQVYEGIPHLLVPVVYDPKSAAAALRWAVEEMERRYSLLAEMGVRNIQSYNTRVENILKQRNNATSGEPEHPTEQLPEKLPYVVIVADEFADLMMVASKEVETAVARLAQKARAAGIHLIMATQRPSKEVITGLIKANFTCRISFRVSSKIDSRIVLDQNGAESLLGAGDMLFLKPGTSTPQRVHGSFVSEDEVGRIVEHVKAQGRPGYNLDILKSPEHDETLNTHEDEQDPMFEDAVDVIRTEGRASVSLLQRRLKIGYNRAARVMEQLERAGIVGPPDHRGERPIL